MMRVDIISTWSAAGAASYGDHFARQISCYAPSSWNFHLYHAGNDSVVGKRILANAARRVNLLRESLERIHDSDGIADGRVPTSCWRASERQEGYSFRTDACRFAWKVFVLCEHLRTMELPTASNQSLLVWLDADVKFRRIPPRDLWQNILGDFANIACLRRPGKWVESGCVIYRLPDSLPFLADLESLYNDSLVDQKTGLLEQWHDGWVLEHLVSQLPLWQVRDFGPHWETSPLAPYFDHLKGRRKGTLETLIIPEVLS